MQGRNLWGWEGDKAGIPRMNEECLCSSDLFRLQGTVTSIPAVVSRVLLRGGNLPSVLVQGVF